MKKTSIICTLLLILVLAMNSGFSQTCTSDEDCDDGIFCNGIETCDEENNRCVSIDPCPELSFCYENNGVCRPIDPWYFHSWTEIFLQSRWVPRPVFFSFFGAGFDFDSSTSVTFRPPGTVWTLPPTVLDEENIFTVGLLMPLWLTGTLDSGTMTVSTDTQEFSAGIMIQVLSYADEWRSLKSLEAK